jgi:malic enzyme
VPLTSSGSWWGRRHAPTSGSAAGNNVARFHKHRMNLEDRTQCNNIYIFPAIGLGVVASGARRVTDTMILAAAGALAENSPALQDAAASLPPALADLRQVAVHIATAVGLEAQRASVAPKTTEEELRQRVRATQWTPAYPYFATSKM